MCEDADDISSTDDIQDSHICSKDLEEFSTARPEPAPNEPWRIVIIKSDGWFLMDRFAQKDGLVIGIPIGYCPFCGEELMD